MTEKLQNPVETYCRELAQKRTTVLGIGISNLPLIYFLHEIGVKRIRAVDSGGRNGERTGELRETCEKMLREGILQDYRIGDGYLEGIGEDTDVIFKSPAVRFDLPELADARRRGVTVTTEMGEFLRLCPARIYAVTGSDGKTTTTTLLYKMLAGEHEKDGVRVWLGGNIGQPLFRYIREIRESDLVVLELSSFQLMEATLRPAVSVITNISPNHLDVHKSYEEYINAKKNIFLQQRPGAVTVLNADNAVTASLAPEVPCECRLFSYESVPENGVYCEDGVIFRRKAGGAPQEILKTSRIRLPGRHNTENYMAAIAAVADDVSVQTVEKIADTFGGVEHRLEFVRELRGVKYYNSSIDSSPNRTAKALSVFQGKQVVLIAGGKDKNIPYSEIGAPIAEKVKTLILTGPTAEKIEQAVRAEFAQQGREPDLAILHCATYEEAVKCAQQSASCGDTVLLSPASTSFDMFRNFEERGNVFKKLVRALI